MQYIKLLCVEKEGGGGMLRVRERENLILKK